MIESFNISGPVNFYKSLYNNENNLYSATKPEFDWVASNIKNTDRVLDIGCGTGCFADYLQSNEYVGIDSNPASVKEGRRLGRNIVKGSVIDFAKIDISKFDTICAFQVLEHLDNPLKFLADISSSMPENSRLIITVPNLNSFLTIRENTPLNMPPHHLTRWSLKSLIKTASAYNLFIEDFHEFKSSSFTNMIYVTLKSNFNSLLKKKRTTSINLSVINKIINILLFNLARALPLKPVWPCQPNSSSICVILRRRN